MTDNVNQREVNQLNSLNLPAGTSMTVVLIIIHFSHETN